MEESNLNQALPSLALLLDIFPSGRNGAFSIKFGRLNDMQVGLIKTSNRGMSTGRLFLMILRMKMWFEV
jgi:hypothetical protein